MALVFLHYNEIGFVFRGDARQVLDILVLAIAGDRMTVNATKP
jgi:hypothetical protein